MVATESRASPSIKVSGVFKSGGTGTLGTFSLHKGISGSGAGQWGTSYDDVEIWSAPYSAQLANAVGNVSFSGTFDNAIIQGMAVRGTYSGCSFDSHGAVSRQGTTSGSPQSLSTTQTVNQAHDLLVAVGAIQAVSNSFSYPATFAGLPGSNAGTAATSAGGSWGVELHASYRAVSTTQTLVTAARFVTSNPYNAYIIADALTADAPGASASTGTDFALLWHDDTATGPLGQFLQSSHPGITILGPGATPTTQGAAVLSKGYKIMEGLGGYTAQWAQNNTLRSCSNGANPGAVVGTPLAQQQFIDKAVAAGTTYFYVDEPWEAPCDPTGSATSAMSIAYNVAGFNLVYNYIHSKYPGVMFGLSIGDDGGAPLHLKMLQAGLHEDFASEEDFNSCCTSANPFGAMKSQFPNVKQMVLAWNTQTLCQANNNNYITPGGLDIIGFWNVDNYGSFAGPLFDANWLQNALTFASTGQKSFCTLPVSYVYAGSRTWSTQTANFTVPVTDTFYQTPTPYTIGVCDWMVMSGPNAVNGPSDLSVKITLPWTRRTCNSSVTVTVGAGGYCRDIGTKTCLVFTRASTTTGVAGNVSMRNIRSVIKVDEGCQGGDGPGRGAEFDLRAPCLRLRRPFMRFHWPRENILVAGLGRPEIPERQRIVAQPVHSRNAVLPFFASGSGKQVGRAGREGGRRAPNPRPPSSGSGTCIRSAGRRRSRGRRPRGPCASRLRRRARIPSPAAVGRRPRRGRRTGRPSRGRHEDAWDGLRLAELRFFEVIAPAERHDAPLAGKAVKLERLEWQTGDLGDERALFALVEKIQTIAEAVRQTGIDLEQAQLVGHDFSVPTGARQRPRVTALNGGMPSKLRLARRRL